MARFQPRRGIAEAVLVMKTTDGVGWVFHMPGRLADKLSLDSWPVDIAGFGENISANWEHQITLDAAVDHYAVYPDFEDIFRQHRPGRAGLPAATPELEQPR